MTHSKDAKAFANAQSIIGSFQDAQDIASQAVAVGFVPKEKLLEECAAGMNGISHLNDAESMAKLLMERHEARSVEAPQVAGAVAHKSNSIT